METKAVPTEAERQEAQAIFGRINLSIRSQIGSWLPDMIAYSIAAARVAERERCAKIAEPENEPSANLTGDDEVFFGAVYETRANIAAAIRKD